MATQPEKAFCVLEFHSTKSVITVQRGFHWKFQKILRVRTQLALSGWVAILLPCQLSRSQWSSPELHYFSGILQKCLKFSFQWLHFCAVQFCISKYLKPLISFVFTPTNCVGAALYSTTNWKRRVMTLKIVPASGVLISTKNIIHN